MNSSFKVVVIYGIVVGKLQCSSSKILKFLKVTVNANVVVLFSVSFLKKLVVFNELSFVSIVIDASNLKITHFSII